MRKYFLVIVCLGVLSGCQLAEKTGQLIYEPIISETTTEESVTVRIPEVIDVNGTIVTNWVERSEIRPVTIVSTNSWRLNPNIGDGIRLFGDVAPFPWAGTVSTLLLGALGVGAHAMSRRWKKVATEGVQFGLDVRDELKKHSNISATHLKQQAVRRQKANGTKYLVDSLIANLK